MKKILAIIVLVLVGTITYGQNLSGVELLNSTLYTPEYGNIDYSSDVQNYEFNNELHMNQEYWSKPLEFIPTLNQSDFNIIDINNGTIINGTIDSYQFSPYDGEYRITIY